MELATRNATQDGRKKHYSFSPKRATVHLCKEKGEFLKDGERIKPFGISGPKGKRKSLDARCRVTLEVPRKKNRY